MNLDPNLIRILAVDDHAIFRQGIVGFLADQTDLQLVAEASNGKDAIQQYRAHLPDITLTDLQMPEMSGLDAVIAIRGEFPDAKIIVLTTYTGDVQVLRALKAGARAYLLKNLLHKELLETIITGHGDVPMTVQAMRAGAQEFLTKPFNDEVLLAAIRQALERSRIVLGRELETQGLKSRYALLTGRECEVMALVASGRPNKQVGSELGISEITVKAHRGRVMQKMQADSIADLVRIAGKLRLARVSGVATPRL